MTTLQRSSSRPPKQSGLDRFFPRMSTAQQQHQQQKTTAQGGIRHGHEDDEGSDDEMMNVSLSELMTASIQSSTTSTSTTTTTSSSQPRSLKRQRQSNSEEGQDEGANFPRGVGEATDDAPPAAAAASVQEGSVSIRQALVPSIRRIFSQAAMEFIPPQATTTTTTAAASGNLLHQRLMQRTTIPSSRPWAGNALKPLLGSNSSTMDDDDIMDNHITTSERKRTSHKKKKKKKKRSKRSTTPWQCPPWVELAAPSNTKVEHMAWDPMGVLLAVALANRSILIYDWDTVRAADIKGKAEQLRGLQLRRQWKQAQEQEQQEQEPPSVSVGVDSTMFSIPPMMQFTLAHSISYLQWNPFNPDQLAVGFKVQGFAHLYQLDAIVAWQEDRQRRQASQSHNSWNTDNNSSSFYPPPSTFVLLQPPLVAGTAMKNGTVNAIVFQRGDHDNDDDEQTRVVVSVGHSVYCWKLLSSTEEPGEDQDALMAPYFQWRYQPPSACTCVSLLTRATTTTAEERPSFFPKWILLGTLGGTFCLLDCTQTTKERAAFSLQDKPVVLQEWSLPAPIKGVSCGSTVQVQVSCTLELSSISATCTGGVLGQFQLTWITSGGWALQSRVEVMVGRRSSSSSVPAAAGSAARSSSQLRNRSNVAAPPLSKPHSRRGLFGAAASRKNGSKDKLVPRRAVASTFNSESTAATSNILGNISVVCSSTNVLYAPPKIGYSSKAAESTVLGKEYSVPLDTMRGHVLCGSWMAWPETPAMHKMLGHGDKYMLDHSTKIERASERVVRFYHVESTETVRMPVSTLPQAMALHPGLEWMVMGVGTNLTMMVNRS